jgi:zinc transporter ZupT
MIKRVALVSIFIVCVLSTFRLAAGINGDVFIIPSNSDEYHEISEHYLQRFVMESEASSIMHAYDGDGDGQLQFFEFRLLYDILVPDPILALIDQNALNVSDSAFPTSTLDSNATDLCLNASSLFIKFDYDSNQRLNVNELSDSVSHLTLIAALCTPVFAELPACKHTREQSYIFGILSAFIIALTAFGAAVLIPLQRSKIPIMELFLSFATSALLADTIMQVIPELMLSIQMPVTKTREEERLANLNYIEGPLLLSCCTILFLFFVEKFLHSITGEHGHTHGEIPPLTEEEEKEARDHDEDESFDSKGKCSADIDIEGKSSDLSTESGMTKVDTEESSSETKSDQKAGKGKVKRRSLKDVKSLGWLVFCTECLHNFIDGLTIGISYLAGLDIGLSVSLAIIFHEIPKKMGIYSLLVRGGFTRRRALLFNFMAAFMSVFGSILGLSLGNIAMRWILGIALGAFLYLPLVEILPQLQQAKKTKLGLVFQIVGLVLGYGVILLISTFQFSSKQCRKVN